MNPFIRSEIKGLKPLSVETSILGYSKLNSLSDSADSSEESQLVQMANSGKSVSQSNSMFSNVDHDIDAEVLDGINFNRESITPNTIIVSRAQLLGHGEVPVVESTDMGRVTYCQLFMENGAVDVYIVIATKKSVRVNNPKWDYHFQREIKRLEVGAHGSIPLIDHDFDSGEEIKVDGEYIQSIFVDGGVLCTSENYESTGPKLIVVFKDRPGGVCYQVDYIRLECKPLPGQSPVLTQLVTNRKLKKRRYFRVFQCPGNHDHCSH